MTILTSKVGTSTYDDREACRIHRWIWTKRDIPCLQLLVFKEFMHFTQLQHVHKRVKECMKKKKGASDRVSLSGEAPVEETQTMQESSNTHSTHIATREPLVNMHKSLANSCMHSLHEIVEWKGVVAFHLGPQPYKQWPLQCALPIVKHALGFETILKNYVNILIYPNEKHVSYDVTIYGTHIYVFWIVVQRFSYMVFFQLCTFQTRICTHRFKNHWRCWITIICPCMGIHQAHEQPLGLGVVVKLGEFTVLDSL